MAVTLVIIIITIIRVGNFQGGGGIIPGCPPSVLIPEEEACTTAAGDIFAY